MECSQSKKMRASGPTEPLASRVRPEALEDLIGLDHFKEAFLPKFLALGKMSRLPSLILWGGAGSGKTTLARCLARNFSNSVAKGSVKFVEMSSATHGVPELRKELEVAVKRRGFGQSTVMFLDEIHRYNKAQQDVLLPYVENGSIILIGATTENPLVEINRALISRCHTIRLEPFAPEQVKNILTRAIRTENLHEKVTIESEVIDFLANYCNGDARAALNDLELLIDTSVDSEDQSGTAFCFQKGAGSRKRKHAFDSSAELSRIQDEPRHAVLSKAECSIPAADGLEHDRDGLLQHEDTTQSPARNDGNPADAGSKLTTSPIASPRNEHPAILPVASMAKLKHILQNHIGHIEGDKSGEEHYNLLSAFHKSMRGSDPNATLYWLCRMIQAGMDPVSIARRMIAFASEDIGAADNSALPLAVACMQAVKMIGLPECGINLAHVSVYLANSKKSVYTYKAYRAAESLISREPIYSQLPVPMYLRNVDIRNDPNRIDKVFQVRRGSEAESGPVSYVYPPDNGYLPSCDLGQPCLPALLEDRTFFDERYNNK